MIDLDLLLSRDHAELDSCIRTLIETSSIDTAWSTALDTARLCFAAHAGATECVVNHVLAGLPTLRGPMLDQVLAAHCAQEALLQRLMRSASRDQITADALELRELLLAHDEHDRFVVLPTLRRGCDGDDYARMAQLYATERVRALGQLGTLAVPTLDAPSPGIGLAVR
ncbi:MAG TPA: hypothetical protein VIV40_13965 [Kofleriaceae bacterium]